MSIFKRIFLLSSLALLIAGPSLALAADTAVTLEYAPPCVGTTCQPVDLTSSTVLQQYLVRLYWFAVGISGIVAVLMIVYGGLLYTTSELIGKKQEGKNHIQNALVGMALLFGAYFILNQVNPNIVDLTSGFKDFKTLNAAPTSTPKDTGVCAPSMDIKGDDHTPIAQGAVPDPGNTCKYRKLYIPENFVINSSGDYYSIFNYGNTSVGPGGIIWVYPYFTTKNGTSTARCIVYAYRKQGEKGSTFTSLQNSIEPCYAVKQEKGTNLSGSDIAAANASKCPTSTLTQSPACTSPSEMGTISYNGKDMTLVDMAKELVKRGTAQRDTNGSCSPKDQTSAFGVVNDLTKDVSPLVCHHGCSTDQLPCQQDDRVMPTLNLMRSLLALSENRQQPYYFKINSLTGGDHSTNSPHYSGRGVDLVPQSNTSDANTWIFLLNGAKAAGFDAMCEYNTATTTVFDRNTCPNPSTVSNLHIHAQ